MDQVRSKNWMHGRSGSPVVELASAPFNTAFGMQRRGDFKALGKWLDLSGSDQALSGPGLKALPEPTLAEALDDEIPDFGTDDPPWNGDVIENKPTRTKAARRK
jgi:hypothetical protein